MKPAHQVLGSAANMDRALAAGLSREQLLMLAVARSGGGGGLGPGVDVAAYVQALRHPGAAEFDEVFVRRELRRLRL